MPPQWYVQMEWFGVWVTVTGLYRSRESAERAVAVWKKENQHYRDNFRYRQQASEPPKGEDTLRDIGVA